jgi:hypothetical protein
MAPRVVHSFVSTVADEQDPGLVGPDEWNADHTITGAAADTTEVIAGAGLTGGGTLAADRTLVVGAGTGITVNADDVALDVAHARNVDHTAVTLTAGAGLTGGGDISASWSFAVGAGAGIAVNTDDVALADMAQATIKGRAAGAGTGAPQDLTATQATAILDEFVGDGGSGGTKGLVPAPATGDAAKFLQGDATWADVPNPTFDSLAPTTTRGDIIFRNATTNARLAAGTSGYHLQAAGAGADPAWAGFLRTGTGAVTRTWNSKCSERISVLDFGATGDGTTDDSTAFTNAIAAASGKVVWVPWTSTGYNLGTTQFTIDDYNFIEGENYVKLKSTSTTSLFRVTGYNFECGISDFTIDMTGAGASSTAVLFGTSGGIVFRARLSKLRFENCVEAVGQETHASNYISDLIADNIYCIKTRGRQIYIKRSRGFVLFRDVAVDHVHNASVDVNEGARFEDFVGLELTRFDLVNIARDVGTPTFNAAVWGLVIVGAGTGKAAVWLDRVYADTCDGNGILINDVRYLFTKDLEAVNNLGYQIYLLTVNEAKMSNTLALGASGLTGAVATTEALRIESCANVLMSDVAATYGTGSGVYLHNSTDVNITNLTAANNGVYGVLEDGTSDRNSIIGAQFSTNTSGDKLLSGASSYVVTDLKNLAADLTTAVGPLSGFRNRLINGCFRINQRQATSIADDTYCLDRWYVLVQTAAITVARQQDIENGLPYAIRMTQSQASAQRMGLAQIIESANCRELRGSSVVLSARVQCSASTTLRYAILEWTGTADAVTSDVVNDWTSGTFTAGNFFNSTTLTVSATGSTALTANTPASITALTATLGSSVNNVIVIFWTDSTQAQSVTLDIGKVQLAQGSVAHAFERRPFSAEHALCQRYYSKSFALGTAPADNVATDRYAGFAWSGTELDTQRIYFPAIMRIPPAVTAYSGTNGTPANGKWQIYDGVSAFQNGTTTAIVITDTSFAMELTALTVASKSAYISYGGWVALAEL